MKVTRREFIQGGVAAFTVSFAAPAFLSELARAQGASRRNLVVLYLAGGNDALRRSFRTPTASTTAAGRRSPCRRATCCRSAPTAAGKPLGLHPRLTGLQADLRRGHLAIIQRTGYPNSSRSHFQGTDIWSTANPANSIGPGWLGRYLDTLPSPVDPLVGWCTIGEVPHTLIGKQVSVPAIPSPTSYAFQSPNTRRRGDVTRARR